MYALGKSITITDNNQIQERDTPIMDITQLKDNCYKITDANYESINLEMDKLYHERIMKYAKKSKGFGQVELPSINFTNFLNCVYEEFGEGEYTINAITHQPFIFETVDGQGIGDDMLIRTEVSCKVYLKDDDFDTQPIHHVEPYIFIPEMGTVIDMPQWKKMNDMMEGDESKEFIEHTSKEMETKLSELFMNQCMIGVSHVWDKLNVTRQRVYD